MTREEIVVLAKQIVDDVEGVNDSGRSYEYVADSLASLRRATLEEAARAVCFYCDAGIQLSERDAAGDLWHVSPYGRCDAAAIHDLIAALDKEASNDQG